MKRILAAFLLVWVAMILGGCSAAPADSLAEPEKAAEKGAFTVVDALGREVTFEKPPERITLAGRGVFMLANAMFAFPQASERLIAIGKTSQWQGDFAPIVDPRYAEKTILETESGPEQIAATQPDLVILKSFMAENLGKPLEALGIPVIYLDFEVPDQYPRDLAILGEIFQNPERAAQINRYYQQELDSLEKALAGLSEDQKPRIAILYYTDRDGQTAFNVPPEGWIQTQMARLAGARPVWTDIELSGGWTKVNFEQIAAWDPDQIYLVAYTSDAVKVVEALKRIPEWQSLRAVQTGSLHAFPADYYSWDQPDPRWILGLNWLAAMVHPDRFQGQELREEVRGFFKEMYGFSDETIENIIFPTLGELP